MNRFLATAALLTFLFHGAAASAAEATGWISHLDGKFDRFYLDDGRVFGVSEDINFASLSDGVRVRIQYKTFDGDRIATDIMPAPGVAPRAAVLQADREQMCSDGNKSSLNGAISKPDPVFC